MQTPPPAPRRRSGRDIAAAGGGCVRPPLPPCPRCGAGHGTSHTPECTRAVLAKRYDVSKVPAAQRGLARELNSLMDDLFGGSR